MGSASFTLGQTPAATIAAALPAQYRMDLNPTDFATVRAALVFTSASSQDAKDMLADIENRLGLSDPELAAIYKKHLNLNRDEMLILLRALAAYGLEEEPSEDTDNAVGLRTDILGTIDIEEI